MTLVLPALVAALVSVASVAVRRWVVPSRPLTDAAPSVTVAARRRSPRTRARADDDHVAAWCEQVARGVRAGHSLGRAVVQAAIDVPAGAGAFQPVIRALSRGRGLAEALDEAVVDNSPSSASGLVVPVLTACAELGGAAALPLERVAATLHARSAERAERRTNSAQARLSARVLSTVPVGVLGLLVVAEPAVRSILATPAGAACVVLGGLFNLTGWCWMRHLIDGAQ